MAVQRKNVDIEHGKNSVDLAKKEKLRRKSTVKLKKSEKGKRKNTTEKVSNFSNS